MEDDQQFCLRWNNHQATLISVFDKLLEKGIHVDCTLAAEGQTLKAHKVVLSACSPYFESVLSQQYDKHPIIILKDVKYAELKAMMDYMYRGEVNISQDQLAALLKAAESLQIKGLSDNKPSPPPPQMISPPKQQLQCESLSGETEDEEESLSCASSSVSGRKRLKRSDSPNVLMPNENNNLPPASSSPIPTLTPSAPHNGRHDTDDPPSTSAINDVVQNFQWHMERNAQEEFNQDGQRDSQDNKNPSAEPKTSPDLNLRPRTRALNQPEVVTKTNDEHKETNISSALLSLLRAQHRAPPELRQPQAKEFAAFSVLTSNVPIVTKMEDFVDAAFRNNNKLENASDVKFECGRSDDGSSDAEFDDTDDIVLPDDTDSQYGNNELNSAYEGGRTHSGSSGDDTSRPFECRHCGKRYRWKSTLRRHENVECGGKAPSHQCPYCDYKAKQRGNLGVHIRKHHNKEWYVYATNRVRKNKKESVA